LKNLFSLIEPVVPPSASRLMFGVLIGDP